ncbi:unnamed protein product, partial [Ectocarpus sp. 12 AP-2014]
MKWLSVSALLALVCSVAQSQAEPCVSATFDVPFPGATDVVTLHADVPSPQFPGLWQEGVVDGFFYALYANGEGYLRSSRDIAEWNIQFTCDAGETDCSIATNGAPPDNARETANMLAFCMQGRPLPVQEVIEEIAPELVDQVEP